MTRPDLHAQESPGHSAGVLFSHMRSIVNVETSFVEFEETAVRLSYGETHMPRYQVSIYHRGRKRLFSANDWTALRDMVKADLVKRPEAKWGELRNDAKVYVKLYRKTMRGFPREEPK